MREEERREKEGRVRPVALVAICMSEEIDDQRICF